MQPLGTLSYETSLATKNANICSNLTCKVTIERNLGQVFIKGKSVIVT